MTDELVVYDFHFPPKLKVGFPSTGGVWIAKFTHDERVFDPTDKRKPYLDRQPDDFRRIEMALTMDERCEVLQGFGATFYKRVEDCDDIPKSLGEGLERGKRFEELLKQMDDAEYSAGFQYEPNDELK
jgi:hypothetical protein